MGIVSLRKIPVKNGLKPQFLRSVGREVKHWDWAEHPRRLKCVNRQDLIGADADITLSVMPGVFGETPLEDLMVICALAPLKAPRRLFEFGTFTGNTTLNFAMNTPREVEILTLDLSPEERAAMGGERWEKTFGPKTVGRRFKNTPHASKFTQLLMDSTRLRADEYAGSIDFVFIDACHDYELVKNDSEKSMRMLPPGGVVVWHDYTRGFPGVCRYLEEAALDRDIRWVDGTSVAVYGSI
jgi:predicted O-methyltransferase YrrM